MRVLTVITALAALVLACEAALKNSSQEYYLQTKLKPGQSGKARFDGLWIEAYHTGAGLDDAVAVDSKKNAAKGFLNGTNGDVGGVKCMFLTAVHQLGQENRRLKYRRSESSLRPRWRLPIYYGARDECY